MTAPLTPPDCDLRDFPSMLLDVQVLRDSGLAAQPSGDVFRAAVLLWCASWHQVPAGSLPDDDSEISGLAGYGRAAKEWAKIRAGALRGFVSGGDGRIYHPVVAEKALAAWIDKLQQRKSSGAGNAKRYGHAFDHAEFDHAIALAAAMLKSLNPRAKALKALSRSTAKAVPTPSDPPPGGSPAGTPDPLPPGSQGKGEGEGKDKKEEDPEAIASAAGAAKTDPPNALDLKKAVFDAGIPMLMATGLNRDRAAAMLGKWRKSYTDGPVLDALTAAHNEAASDPIPFITRILEARNGRRSDYHNRQSGWLDA